MKDKENEQGHPSKHAADGLVNTIDRCYYFLIKVIWEIITIPKEIWHIMVHADQSIVRVMLALAEIFWAIGFFAEGDTTQRATYANMAFMPEMFWAWAFAISAFFQLLAVKYRYYYCTAAAVFAWWNSFLWVFCVGSMYLAISPPPAAIGGEASLALFSVWVFFLTNTDRRRGARHND